MKERAQMHNFRARDICVHKEVTAPAQTQSSRGHINLEGLVSTFAVAIPSISETNAIRVVAETILLQAPRSAGKPAYTA